MNTNLDNLATAVWVYDIDNYCIHSANSAALDLWEAESLSDLRERNFKPETSNAVQKTLLDYRSAFEKGKSVSMFWRYTPKGIAKEAFCQMSGYLFADGRIGLQCEAVPAHLINTKASKSSLIMLSTYDLKGEFISANHTFIEQMGAQIKQLSQLFSDSKDSREIFKSLAQQNDHTGDYKLSTLNGDLWFHLQISIPGETYSEREILVQQFDVNQRKLEQMSLIQQANTDPLTGLLNRRGLKERLEKNVQTSNGFFIYYIDLDSFKMINDSMGHAVGDLILKTLAERLCSSMFKQAIASRFGGDEFILVVNKETSTLSQGSIANRLLEIINQPYADLEGNPVLLSASVGSACYPKDGTDLNKILLRADAAMYVAKSQGKKRGIRYSKGMEDQLQRQSLVARYLYLAIENSEFELHYQPIMNVEDNSIYAFEALLRWRNPSLGLVPPEETIAIAEQIGIIVDVENWVIKQAITDLPKLRCTTDSRALISINITATRFTDAQLPQYLLQVLGDNHLKPADLEVELTETTLLKDIDNQHNCAKLLTDQGISISIDDFGTGYSSLAYLHQIPASIVKIDRLFTARITDNSKTISSIHNLLKSMGLITLVEGVETRRQSELLQEIGISLQQGYGLGRPQPLSYYIEKSKTPSLNS